MSETTASLDFPPLAPEQEEVAEQQAEVRRGMEILNSPRHQAVLEQLKQRFAAHLSSVDPSTQRTSIGRTIPPSTWRDNNRRCDQRLSSALRPKTSSADSLSSVSPLRRVRPSLV